MTLSQNIIEVNFKSPNLFRKSLFLKLQFMNIKQPTKKYLLFF